MEIFNVMLKLHQELFEKTLQKAKEAGLEIEMEEEDDSDEEDGDVQ